MGVGQCSSSIMLMVFNPHPLALALVPVDLFHTSFILTSKMDWADKAVNCFCLSCLPHGGFRVGLSIYRRLTADICTWLYLVYSVTEALSIV